MRRREFSPLSVLLQVVENFRKAKQNRTFVISWLSETRPDKSSAHSGLAQCKHLLGLSDAATEDDKYLSVFHALNWLLLSGRGEAFTVIIIIIDFSPPLQKRDNCLKDASNSTLSFLLDEPIKPRALFES